MTTVCATNKIIAADSCVGLGANASIKGRHYAPSKVFRYEGSLWGFGGTVFLEQEFKLWLENRETEDEWFTSQDFKDTDSPHIEVIQIDPKGRVWFYYDGSPRVNMNPPEALGTGAPFAISAMYMGADPRLAVKIAAQLDPASAPPVDYLLYQLHKQDEKFEVLRDDLIVTAHDEERIEVLHKG